MKSNNAIVAILLVVIIFGAYAIYRHDQRTTTIDLPGNNKIEITK